MGEASSKPLAALGISPPPLMDIPERAESYLSARRGIALTALTDIPQQPLGLGLGIAAAAWCKAWVMMLFPFRDLGSLGIVGTKILARVAPVVLCPYWSSLPRVWSPLQGYAPWALIEVAPLGLARLLLVFGASGWEGSSLVGEKFVLSALRGLYISLGARPVYVWGACPIVLTRSLH